VLLGGYANYTDIEGVPIQLVYGQNDSRARLVQLNQIDLTSFWEPSERWG